jgi:hypothetical protein
MHDPRSSHMDVVYRILRYLKSCQGRVFYTLGKEIYKLSATLMLTGQALWMIGDQLLDIVHLWEVTWLHGEVRSKVL